VGWIGTGVMGALHVPAPAIGLEVSPHPLHPEPQQGVTLILAKGATWADSPRAVAEQTEVVMTMVGLPRDVREVYFGEQGVLAGVQARAWC
jgi:3-hydroxyisobutyrate dehydrogenase